jgi:hypothetical protein
VSVRVYSSVFAASDRRTWYVRLGKVEGSPQDGE